MVDINPEVALNDFLTALHDVVTQYNERGMSDDLPTWFDDKVGICDNWSNYTDAVITCDPDVNRFVWYKGFDLLKDKFARDGLHRMFPFNNGLEHYWQEQRDYALYDNTQRVEWLKAEAEKVA